MYYDNISHIKYPTKEVFLRIPISHVVRAGLLLAFASAKMRQGQHEKVRIASEFGDVAEAHIQPTGVSSYSPRVLSRLFISSYLGVGLHVVVVVASNSMRPGPSFIRKSAPPSASGCHVIRRTGKRGRTESAAVNDPPASDKIRFHRIYHMSRHV